MVRLGLGWTVLPTTQAEHGDHRLARAMTEPLLSRTISAVSRRGGATRGVGAHGALAAACGGGRPAQAVGARRAGRAGGRGRAADGVGAHGAGRGARGRGGAA
jgi:hypothetical protein